MLGCASRQSFSICAGQKNIAQFCEYFREDQLFMKFKTYVYNKVVDHKFFFVKICAHTRAHEAKMRTHVCQNFANVFMPLACMFSIILARACGIPAVFDRAVPFGRSAAANDVVATKKGIIFSIPFVLCRDLFSYFG